MPRDCQHAATAMRSSRSCAPFVVMFRRRSRGLSPGRRSAASACRPRPRRPRPAADARAGAEASDERRGVTRRRLLDGALVADVLCELAHVVGHRVPALDREVHHDLRAERLGELGLARAAAGPDGVSSRAPRPRGPPGRMPRTTVPADVRRRAPGRAFSVSALDRDRLVADLGGVAAVPLLERRLDHVHRRAADEAADEEVDRPVVERLRVVRPAGARPCASRRRGRPSSSPRPGRA